MRKLTLLIVLAIAVTSCNVNVQDEEQTETESMQETEMVDGEALEKEMWADFKSGDMDVVSTKISEAFQSAHQDGARSKAEEMELLKNLDLEEYELTDFEVTQEDNVMVVTYMVSVVETINEKVLNTKPAPRMSVWIKADTAWKWVAHANLKPLDEEK